MSDVDPDGNPNPFSTEYGGDLRTWGAAFAVAIATFIPAFAGAGRTARQLLLVAAGIAVVMSAEPAQHYYRYFIVQTDC